MTSGDFGRRRKTVILYRRRLISDRELMNLRRKRGVLFLNRAGSSIPKDSGQSSSQRTTPMPSVPTLRCDKASGSSMQIPKSKSTTDNKNKKQHMLNDEGGQMRAMNEMNWDFYSSRPMQIGVAPNKEKMAPRGMLLGSLRLCLFFFIVYVPFISRWKLLGWNQPTLKWERGRREEINLIWVFFIFFPSSEMEPLSEMATGSKDPNLGDSKMESLLETATGFIVPNRHSLYFFVIKS
ncbi:hypothetical protein LINPERPRIM_LOCUS17119 [Linum perenne]